MVARYPATSLCRSKCRLCGYLRQLLVMPEQLLFVNRNAKLLFDSLLDVANGLLVLDPADAGSPQSWTILG